MRKFLQFLLSSVVDLDPDPDPYVLDLLDPDSLVRGTDPDPASSKNTWKNDVNVPSKSNRQKNFLKIIFCCRLEGQGRKWQDPDPLVRGTDPYQNVKDPQHCF